MMDTPNHEQRDFWSGPSGKSWIAAEAEMDRMLRPVADVILERAELSEGQRVVDIGCGAGALSEMAAEVVGQSGRVLATDISEPLLARTAERLRDLPQATTFLAHAEVAEWPETGFDLAVSRFGVMFFSDPPRAFANIRRALKPGGQAVFAAWAPVDGQPYWQVPQQAAVARLGRPPRVEPDTPGPFGLANPDLAHDRLKAGGFDNVKVETLDLILPHAGGASAVADLFIRVGPARRVINLFNAQPSDVAAIRASISAAMADFETAQGVAVPARIHLITGTA